MQPRHFIALLGHDGTRGDKICKTPAVGQPALHRAVALRVLRQVFFQCVLAAMDLVLYILPTLGDNKRSAADNDVDHDAFNNQHTNTADTTRSQINGLTSILLHITCRLPACGRTLLNYNLLNTEH